MFSPRHRLGRGASLPALLLGFSVAVLPAVAQTNVTVPPDTTPPQPSAAQPVLPGAPTANPKPDFPVVEQIERGRQPSLDVRKGTSRPAAPKRRHLAHRSHRSYAYGPAPIERPALAGVELVAPLPPPVEPPHIFVPVPAYPLEAIAAGITTPPPPIVCHPTRRDPYAPDPRLYREETVECVPDNP